MTPAQARKERQKVWTQAIAAIEEEIAELHDQLCLAWALDTAPAATVQMTGRKTGLRTALRLIATMAKADGVKSPWT